MRLTKEQAEERAADTSRSWTGVNEGPITEVSRSRRWGYSISMQGTGFGISHKNLGRVKPPEVGDMIKLYTRGSTIRGVDLRGKPLYYKTDAELDAEHEQWKIEHKAKKRKTFEKERRKLDRDFASLPDVFQRRISWFRANNPDFRWDLEAYEMAVCVDAVKIAEACGTEAKVRQFQKRSYKKQHELIPDLYDGHSGNSFGAAINLAWLYLKNPLFVIAEHGSMTPLTGCEEFGCAHPRPADVMAAIEEERSETVNA